MPFPNSLPSAAKMVTASPDTKSPSTPVIPTGRRLLPESRAPAAPSSTVTLPIDAVLYHVGADTGSDDCSHSTASSHACRAHLTLHPSRTQRSLAPGLHTVKLRKVAHLSNDGCVRILFRVGRV